MTRATTPTGIPIRLCELYSIEHPITRKHCTRCGRPSLFINADDLCLLCQVAPRNHTDSANAQHDSAQEASTIP